jgi:sugar phosphate isomerase/epimerase
MRPIGLQLYTLRKPFAADPLGTLSRIRETGYDAVEFAAPLGSDFAGFAAHMREIGLDCPSAHAGLADMAEQPDAVLAMARTLGCRYLVMPYVLPEQRDWTSVIATLGVFAKRARAEGLRVGRTANGPSTGWWPRPTRTSSISSSTSTGSRRAARIPRRSSSGWPAG